MPFDITKASQAEKDLVLAGAKAFLEKAKDAGQEELVIPDDVQAFLDEKGMTIEAKQPAQMAAVDTDTATPDAEDLKLDGIGPSATPKASPAILHDATKRTASDISLAHMVGIMAMGKSYPYLVDAGLEIEILGEQQARGKGPQTEAGQKALAAKQAMLKDLNIGSEVAGTFLIPTELHDEIITKLRGQEIWMRMGVDYLPDSPKFQEWDKEGRDPQVFWPGDTPKTDISESDIDYGDVTLTLKSMACVVPIRLNLIKHARRNVEAEVRNRIVSAMAVEQTKVGLRGLGGKQPLGLFNHPSMVQYTTTGIGIPNFNDLLDAMSLVRARDGVIDVSQSAWVMPEIFLNILRKSKTGTAEYDYITDLTAMPSDRLLGLPVFTSSKIRTDLGVGSDESRAMLVGNKNAIMLADGGQTEITILKELYALQFKIGVLAAKEIDFGIRREAELQFLTGLTTS